MMKKNSIFIVHIVMPNKSYNVYKKVFKEILNLLGEYKLRIKFKDKIITCDLKQKNKFQRS